MTDRACALRKFFFVVFRLCSAVSGGNITTGPETVIFRNGRGGLPARISRRKSQPEDEPESYQMFSCACASHLILLLLLLHTSQLAAPAAAAPPWSDFLL